MPSQLLLLVLTSYASHQERYNPQHATQHLACDTYPHCITTCLRRFLVAKTISVSAATAFTGLVGGVAVFGLCLGADAKHASSSRQAHKHKSSYDALAPSTITHT
jgi:hypothetical protein